MNYSRIKNPFESRYVKTTSNLGNKNYIISIRWTQRCNKKSRGYLNADLQDGTSSKQIKKLVIALGMSNSNYNLDIGNGESIVFNRYYV